MQKAEARGENSSGGLITAESGRSRPGSSASLSVLAPPAKNWQSELYTRRGRRCRGKIQHENDHAAEQSSTVALMEKKNTVRETNGAYESWLFCLLLPLKKKRKRRRWYWYVVESLLHSCPHPLCFFYLIFWSVQLYVAGPFDRCPCPLRTPHGRARRGSLALGCR